MFLPWLRNLQISFMTFVFKHALACMIGVLLKIWNISHLVMFSVMSHVIVRLLVFLMMFALRRFPVLMKLSRKRQSWWVTQHLMQLWMLNFWFRLVFLLQYQWLWVLYLNWDCWRLVLVVWEYNIFFISEYHSWLFSHLNWFNFISYNINKNISLGVII